MSGLSEAGASVPRRRRIGFPPAAPAPTGLRRVAWLLVGLVLFPFYWFAGALLGVPGMRFRCACFSAGVRLLFVGQAADAYHCIVYPLDSVRHFEVGFFWERLRALRPVHVLDVSSPRLLTLLALRADGRAHADLLNPDEKDLARTKSMAKGLGVDSRCRFYGVLINALPAGRAYPVVTCMSVLEHIVDDLAAVRTIWDRVAPGGRLLLSMPFAPEAIEEYSNVDEYGLLDTDEAGYVFWQRYYDEARLQSLFAITGPPVARELYVERVPGAYDKDVLNKRTDPFYPRWREPLATARAFVRGEDLAILSGMGVVALEFTKSPSDT